MKDLIKGRILANEEMFSKEEILTIYNNLDIIIKAYIIGILDSIK